MAVAYGDDGGREDLTYLIMMIMLALAILSTYTDLVGFFRGQGCRPDPRKKITHRDGPRRESLASDCGEGSSSLIKSGPHRAVTCGNNRCLA
jgi:hypothetical protein